MAIDVAHEIMAARRLGNGNRLAIGRTHRHRIREIHQTPPEQIVRKFPQGLADLGRAAPIAFVRFAAELRDGCAGMPAARSCALKTASPARFPADRGPGADQRVELRHECFACEVLVCQRVGDRDECPGRCEVGPMIVAEEPRQPDGFRRGDVEAIACALPFDVAWIASTPVRR